ncbi:MAG: MoxR family ATPase [Lachnospiraceae bacterium]|nr:MoxR family ATPase [Lachnospiraceae bacterium]
MDNKVPQRLMSQINSFIIGKEDVVESILICLLAGGHVLLEDVPGVGKTTLAKVLAGCVGGDFGRIQFTPDTLPTDVTGLSVYNAKTGEFEFHTGAIMQNILLADEINRTSPKTQSALLEAMAEGQVTVDGNRYPLKDPFMVIATQNPIEFLGTYPLPEASLDRFMMRLSIGYPEKDAEITLTRYALEGKTPDQITPVCSLSDICEMRKEVASVSVSDKLLAYIRDIIELTRKEEAFVMGASPRATIFLASAARACAYLQGRDFVKPDDVKAVCVNTLHHRLTLTSQARIRKADIDSTLRNLMLKAKVPME